MELIPIRAGLFTVDPPRLLAARCASCRRHHFPTQATCPYCGADCETVALSDRGTLVLFTVVHNAPPGYRGKAPYGFGVVELPEGLRVISPLTESRLEALRVGLPVRLRVAPLFVDEEGREVMSYAFQPVASDG